MIQHLTYIRQTCIFLGIPDNLSSKSLDEKWTWINWKNQSKVAKKLCIITWIKYDAVPLVILKISHGKMLVFFPTGTGPWVPGNVSEGWVKLINRFRSPCFNRICEVFTKSLIIKKVDHNLIGTYDAKNEYFDGKWPSCGSGQVDGECTSKTWQMPTMSNIWMSSEKFEAKSSSERATSPIKVSCAWMYSWTWNVGEPVLRWEILVIFTILKGPCWFWCLLGLIITLLPIWNKFTHKVIKL